MAQCPLGLERALLGESSPRPLENREAAARLIEEILLALKATKGKGLKRAQLTL